MVTERPFTPEQKRPKGFILVLTGPSAGVGKDTIANEFSRRFNIPRIITYTTRLPRLGEKPDVNYHFVTSQQFDQMKENGEFLECNLMKGHWYGTAKEDVEVVLKRGRPAILVVDRNGIMNIQQYLKEKSIKGNPGLKNAFVFMAILPPNYERWELASWTLARRMLERMGDERKQMPKSQRFKEPKERLPVAKEEIAWLIQHKNLFDALVVNERGKIDKSVEEIRAVIKQRKFNL